MKEKNKAVMLALICTLCFFAYPPKTNLSQQKTTDIEILKQQRSKLIDSVKLGLERVNTKIDLLPSGGQTTLVQSPKVIYRDRVRTVYKDRIIRDTVIVYVPVNKSEYFENSRRWSDSIAIVNEQKKKDSIEFVWENRSWLRKFLGIKPK